LATAGNTDKENKKAYSRSKSAAKRSGAENLGTGGNSGEESEEAFAGIESTDERSTTETTGTQKAARGRTAYTGFPSHLRIVTHRPITSEI
jgi:hypothetical protein